MYLHERSTPSQAGPSRGEGKHLPISFRAALALCLRKHKEDTYKRVEHLSTPYTYWLLRIHQTYGELYNSVVYTEMMLVASKTHVR